MSKKEYLKRSGWVLLTLLLTPIAMTRIALGFFSAGFHGFRQAWRNHGIAFKGSELKRVYFDLDPIRNFMSEDYWK